MPLYRQAGLFNPHETDRVQSLAGAPLAPFARRFWAAAIDFIILAFTNAPVTLALQYFIQQKLHIGEDIYHSASGHTQVKFSMEMTLEVLWTLWLILYFGLFFRFTNGFTPGKRLFGIRVVSLSHDRLSFWQSVERGLGYGASALEGGFGFFQYFLNPNHQCAHDRLAETIVVRELRRPAVAPSPADTAPAE
jgi:uncharacterized RDD family membrane protein YckC